MEKIFGFMAMALLLGVSVWAQGNLRFNEVKRPTPEPTISNQFVEQAITVPSGKVYTSSTGFISSEAHGYVSAIEFNVVS